MRGREETRSLSLLHRRRRTSGSATECGNYPPEFRRPCASANDRARVAKELPAARCAEEDRCDTAKRSRSSMISDRAALLGGLERLCNALERSYRLTPHFR